MSSRMTEEFSCSTATSTSPVYNSNIEDFQCIICFELLIEPVTVPCEAKHSFCLKCFEQIMNLADARCPVCKTRILCWARKMSKLNRLVDTDKWHHIQTAFPLQVEQRQSANENEDTSNFAFVHTEIRIAPPGTVGEEFRRMQNEMEHQLDEERERRHRELNVIAVADHEMAVHIAEMNMEDNEIVDEYLETERDHLLEEAEKLLGEETDVPRLVREKELFPECSYVNEKYTKSIEGPILYPHQNEEGSQQRPVDVSDDEHEKERILKVHGNFKIKLAKREPKHEDHDYHQHDQQVFCSPTVHDLRHHDESSIAHSPQERARKPSGQQQQQHQHRCTSLAPRSILKKTHKRSHSHDAAHNRHPQAVQKKASQPNSRRHSTSSRPDTVNMIRRHSTSSRPDTMNMNGDQSPLSSRLSTSSTTSNKSSRKRRRKPHKWTISKKRRSNFSSNGLPSLTFDASEFSGRELKRLKKVMVERKKRRRNDGNTSSLTPDEAHLEKDLRLALSLQRQFHYEHKMKFTIHREVGTSSHYSLRHRDGEHNLRSRDKFTPGL